MPIKLNGATNGSVELDVPAAVGSDLQITLPATAGTAIVKAADGSVDLGSVDIDSSGNLGIGTAAPSGKLDILTGTTGNVLIDAEGGSNFHAKIVNDSGDLVVGARSTSADTIVTSKRSTVFKTGSSEDERLRVDSSGRLLVGTSSVLSTDSGHIIQASDAVGAKLSLGRDDSSVSSGNAIGKIQFSGNDGGTYQPVAEIACDADGDHASNDKPGRLVFKTTADGASSATERLRIDASGNVKLTGGEALFWDDAGDRYIACTGDASSNINLHGRANVIFKTGGASYDGGSERMRLDSSGRLSVGSTSPVIGNSHSFQAVGTNNSSYAAAFQQNGSGNAGRLLHWELPNTNDANAYFVYGVNSSTNVFEIRANGNVKNQNNSYTSLSDIKLKENIVDANSQWDDIKALRVRNYNFKQSSGYETHTQLGVVAQEVETVSPGLVITSPDLLNGGEELETSTKSVNYSVLYMKAVKALQEAMTRIETLEARVTTLEAG